MLIIKFLNGLYGSIDVDADATTCEWLLSKIA